MVVQKIAAPKMMLRIQIILIIFFYSGLACCNSESNRPSLSDEQSKGGVFNKYAGLSFVQADSLMKVFTSVKQYDSINILARNFIEEKIKKGSIKEAVQADTLAFSLMDSGSALQKNIVYFLFEKREIIIKDTASLKLFYNFFTDTFTLIFPLNTYDPQYVEVAEYFINLQKKHPQLDAGVLIFFKEDLGIAYNVAGDLKKALTYYNEVLTADLQSNNPGYIAGSTSNLCTALIESNLNDSVLNLTNTLLHAHHFSKNSLLNLHTIRAEACMQKNDLKMAADEINQAALLLPYLIHNQDDSIKRAFEIADTKARLLYGFGNFTKCIKESHHALYVYLTDNKNSYHDRYMGKELLLTGAAYRQLHQPDSAIWYFHQAVYTVVNVDSTNTSSLPAGKDVYAENTLVDAIDSLATIWDEEFNRTKNVQFLKEALHARKLAFIAEKKLLEAFSYDEAMQAQLLQSKRRSEKALRNCYTLWKNDQNSNWIEEALVVNENSKAVALLHSVKRNIFLKNLPENDSEVESLNRTRYLTIMSERNLSQTADLKLRDSIRNELDSINRKFLLLESTINERYPSFKRTGTDTAIINLSSLREKLLLNNDCLLQYFVADSSAFVLWINKKMDCGIELLPKEALQLADSFSTECNRQHGLFEKDNAAFFKLAATCTRLIIPLNVQQQTREGNCNKMVVIPDGIFSRLPFEALVVDANEFLINKTTINTGYSLSTLLANDAAPGDNKSLAVFTPFSKQGFLHKARLPFTKDEANAIQSVYHTALIIDDTAATVRNFRNTLQNSGIIHIAAHASTSNEDVPRIFFSDSILYMPELYVSNTKADLIVLSGCETGAGTLDPNEGPLSLSRAFYYAGAKNVINSLWQIDDATTASIFGSFYRRYSAGNTGNALRMAKQYYIKLNPGKGDNPYYWAGFIHIGLDKETGNKKQYRTIILISFSVFFLLIMPLLYWRKRHRKIVVE